MVSNPNPLIFFLNSNPNPNLVSSLSHTKHFNRKIKHAPHTSHSHLIPHSRFLRWSALVGEKKTKKKKRRKERQRKHTHSLFGFQNHHLLVLPHLSHSIFVFIPKWKGKERRKERK